MHRKSWTSRLKKACFHAVIFGSYRLQTMPTDRCIWIVRKLSQLSFHWPSYLSLSHFRLPYILYTESGKKLLSSTVKSNSIQLSRCDTTIQPNLEKLSKLRIFKYHLQLHFQSVISWSVEKWQILICVAGFEVTISIWSILRMSRSGIL